MIFLFIGVNLILILILFFLAKGHLKPTSKKIIASLILALPVASVVLGLEQSIALSIVDFKYISLFISLSSYFYFVYVALTSPAMFIVIFPIGFCIFYCILSLIFKQKNNIS